MQYFLQEQAAFLAVGIFYSQLCMLSELKYQERRLKMNLHFIPTYFRENKHAALSSSVLLLRYTVITCKPLRPFDGSSPVSEVTSAYTSLVAQNIK